ncbi:MAG: chemotaxis protein CheW [Pseudomonadota bacterium]|uniref:chemotaxis protein CheW n=1 Tax=unclassified Phenylobacterium TaxID=2640670 RepID=UPI0006FE0208|nr:MULTISPECIES: chemotaxis protein CheW [unclassified Phenylobacterium]KRB40371.1 chemotaxis protein CheW [Phenylobacterium sp. Root700]MBT9470705.1 purine-binding chemotaxis protein CheW [Phenylobacterium sp.]
MEERTDGKLELISFEIAGQEFCIDIRAVREIRGWTAATPIPHTPPYMLGVINLRGTIMPVIDLRNRLDLGQTQASTRHVIVVVQHGERLAGLLVDAVQETFVIDEALLQDPPAMDATNDARFIDAIIPLEGRMLSRLVVAALLPLVAPLAA